MLASILTFNETWKFKVHILQIALIILAIILSIARVTIKNPPASRANTVAITLVKTNLPHFKTHRAFRLTRKLTPGPQIPPRNSLPAADGAHAPLRQVGEHESERHPQQSRSRLLARRPRRDGENAVGDERRGGGAERCCAGACYRFGVRVTLTT